MDARPTVLVALAVFVVLSSVAPGEACAAPGAPPGDVAVSDTTIEIVYTSGTSGFMEALPRDGRLLGGLAARSSLLARRADVDALIEGGGLFDPVDAIEIRRAELMLEALALMGYDILHLAASDLPVATQPAVAAALARSPLTWVATNVHPATSETPWGAVPSAALDLDGTRAVVLGVVDPDSVRAWTGGLLVATDPEVALTGSLGAHGPEAPVPAGRSDANLEPDATPSVDDADHRGDAGHDVSPPGEALVIVLSDLDHARNVELLRRLDAIDLLIESQAGPGNAPAAGSGADRLPPHDAPPASGPDRDRVEARIAPATPAGLSIGEVVLAGDQRIARMERRPVDATDVVEDAELRGRLAAFYADVHARYADAVQEPGRGGDGTSRPGVVPDTLTPRDRYVGARACAQCHVDAHASWLATPHARAYITLLETRSHYRPACLPCHVTGLGHWSGYQPNGSRPELAAVQCESCHGPGGVHSRLPDATSIRRAVPGRVCESCHTGTQSPDFAATLAAYRASGAFHGPPVIVADALTAALRRDGQVEVELFVMSLCPYGAAAEQQLARLHEQFGAAVDLRVRYIVRETASAGTVPAPAVVGGPSGDRSPTSGAGEQCRDDGAIDVAAHRGFVSLHGPEEVRENLRQLAIAELGTASLLDYLVARAADLDGDWRPAARAAGLDPRAVAAAAGDQVERLAADARRCRELDVRASPTWVVNGIPLAADTDAAALGRRLCEALETPPSTCAGLPACTRDADCRSPGLEGRCVEPGTPAARCQFREAPEVVLHLLNDPTCGLCNPASLVASAMELFPGLRVEAYDVTRGEGAAWRQRFAIDTVPAYVLEGVESAAGFDTLRPVLVAGIDRARGDVAGTSRGDSSDASGGVTAAYRLDPAAFGRGPLYAWRPPVPAAVDVFLRATGPLSGQLVTALDAALSGSPQQHRVRWHHLLEVTVDTTTAALRVVQHGAAASVRADSTVPRVASRLGPLDVAASRRQVCIEALDPGRLLPYLVAGAGDGASADTWRQRAARLGIDVGQIEACAASGAAERRLLRDVALADSLGIDAPAVLVGNRLRFDGLGRWNSGAFRRALRGMVSEAPN